MTRLLLRVAAIVFAVGAALTWETIPQLAGASLVMAVSSYAALLTGRPRPQRPSGGSTMENNDEALAAAAEITKAIAEYGMFRLEGTVKVFCPLCKTWCTAELTQGTAWDAGLSIATDPTSAVTQIHVDLSAHAHAHECPGANATVDTVNHALRNRSE